MGKMIDAKGSQVGDGVVNDDGQKVREKEGSKEGDSVENVGDVEGLKLGITLGFLNIGKMI